MARTKKNGAIECTLQDMLFPVEMIDNPRASNKEYSKIVVGTMNDGGIRDLNYCSSRYELVSNETIFPEIERVLLSNQIEFDVTYSHLNFARFYADYRISDKRYGYHMKNSSKDVIEPMLRVQHSYNGLTKYKIIFGYFRFVCENGLTIPVKEMKDFNLVIIGKHTESIKHSFIMLDAMLKRFATDANQIMEKITEKYELLGGRMVTNVNDRIEEVLKATGIIAVDNKNFNTVENIKNRIDKETYLYNGQVNDWLVFNGINQYLYDNDINIAAPEKRMENDSKVLEFMLA